MNCCHSSTEDIMKHSATAMMMRPARNRRYCKKSSYFGDSNGGGRAIKRLFTPEIKRFLKEWLVRRRDNPYPNREEKRLLATETGLTYIQICNWFANWRRKLKNADDERERSQRANNGTWGHLIKTYNCRARGNVEQFSISSDDSIWDEESESRDKKGVIHKEEDSAMMMMSPKSRIMERYFFETGDNSNEMFAHSELSKWLKSAAGYRASEDWKVGQSRTFSWSSPSEGYCDKAEDLSVVHGREEIEAAMALTRLAGATTYRS